LIIELLLNLICKGSILSIINNKNISWIYCPLKRVNLLYHMLIECVSLQDFYVCLTFKFMYVEAIDLIKRVGWSDNRVLLSWLWVFKELNIIELFIKCFKTWVWISNLFMVLVW